MSNINMSNININNGDGNNDEGYKRFLAFLASSPNPNPNTEENAGAVEGSCPHTSESESEEREQSDQATMSTSTSTSTSKSWEETTGGSVAALISEQLGVDIGTWVDDDDDGEEKSLDDQLEGVHQDRSKALSRPKPKLEAKKEDDHLKSELKEEPAETKGNERRRSSRRLSLNLSLRRSQSNKTARSNSILNNLGEIAAVERPPRAGQHPDYPFENVVFQGGGAKGGVYVGVFQAFEKLGILPYLKRFAGASAGSFPALALALGLSAEQAKAEMDTIDMQGFMDGGSSTISHLRNIKKRLGMHPGDKLLEHFGGVLKKFTGDSDLTFLGLYQRFGTELCISVSNLSRSQGEYLHVTTTPELPIKYAVRASMSIPLVFEPINMSDKGHGMHVGDLYVDGGLFDNFPLTAYDGWFLKVGLDGSFHDQVLKLNPKLLEDEASAVDAVKTFRESLVSRHAEPNQATIGFRMTEVDYPDNVAYSAFLSGLEKKLGTNSLKSKETKTNKDVQVALPDTKLARAYLKKKKLEHQHVENQEVYEEAFAEFCRWFLRHSSSLQSHRVQGKYPPQAIPTHALLGILKEHPPRKEFSYQVLGLESWEEFAHGCQGIDIEAKGYFIKTDINMFWERYGIRDVQMKNRESTTMNGMGSFLMGMLWAPIMSKEEEILQDPANAERCCVLDCKYVGTMDFDLEQGDKEFLYEMGRVETLRWVKKRATDMLS